MWEMEETAGGEPRETFVVTLCAGFGAHVGSAIAGPVGMALGGATVAAYCDSLINNNSPAKSPDINSLSPYEINAIYSRIVYMDGHEVRNGDPYDRWR
jgi:hypothetical protein